MSNYTKSTNFATKDNLSPGDPLKIVRGTEIDTEFNNISTAISTKTDNSAAAITGGSISGITDLAIADGGTGASTATAAINNLLPSQTSNANKYLQTDGTNVSWDAVSLSTSDITGTLPVANGGTGVTSSTGTGSVVLSNSPTLVTPALGTPASGTATNLTGLPISTGVSGLGTGVATFLGTPSSANLASAVSDETGSGALVFANSPTLVTPTLGTPASATLTNATGLPISTGVSGLGTGVATFLATPSSANLRSALTDETGTGSAVFATSPALVTPDLGTPSAATLTNATGLPIATGVSGLGTGVATALAVNVGSAGAPVVNGGALGTPSSGTVTNLTGTASININGTVGATTATTGAFTTLAASSSVTLSGSTANGVFYANGSKVLTSGSALTFNGTAFGIGPQGTSGQLVVADAITTVVAANQDRRYRAALQLGSNFYGGEIYGGLNSGGSQTFNIGVYDGTSTSTVSAVFQANNTQFYVSGSEGMRLTSTGLGIGTSSPAYKLDVDKGSTGFIARFKGGTASAYIYGDNSSVYLSSDTSVATAFGLNENSDYLTLTTAGTERVRVDSAGNLGLGVTPSAWGSTYTALQVKNFGLMAKDDSNWLYSNAYYNGTSILYTGNGYAGRFDFNGSATGGYSWSTAPSGTAGNAISFTQAMTLTKDGDLFVGATTYGVTNGGIQLLPTGFGAGIPFIGNGGNSSSDSQFTMGVYSTSASQYQFYVGYGGTVFARSIVISSLSDQRLKENIVDLDVGLDKIMALKPRKFDWKEGKGTNKKNVRGFIAQELEQVFPDLIDEWADPAPEGEDPYKSVRQDLIPVLVKAMQEQQAVIESLKARLDAANL